MACCFLFFFLVVWNSVRCLSKDESETVCVIQCTVMWMTCCQHWLKELWQISSGDEGGGITARKTTVAVVLGSQCSPGVFFIAQMPVFLNSLLTGKGVKGILKVQITEHVLLFEFSSICELLTAGCNHVSYQFVISIMHYFNFLWLLSSLFTQEKQKGKLDQEGEL